MRDDLNASEKRLIAALDRIDQFLDRADLARRTASGPPAGDAEGAEARLRKIQAENQRLSQDLAALHERQAAMLADCEARLAEAHQRLVHAGQEAARLSAANEALAEANRALIAAQGGGESPDETRRALEAEIESLRAARSAEIAQMGEIIDALDRMIDLPPQVGPAGASETGTAAPAEDGPAEPAGRSEEPAGDLAREGANLDGERG
ncbi:MAG: hypothetical protein D1H97_05170 [Paracoccus sp. BP8]|nr:MAG: hypothetical protein D1H97_05170 [Paracoccus sp. BP8]